MSDPLETLPVPLPAFTTVRVTAGSAVKLASTDTSWVMVNVQIGDVPAHAPVQEPNDETGFGPADSVTDEPGA